LDCKKVIGAVDRPTGGWRLSKRDVKLVNADTTSESFSPVQWFAADLLQSIENDSVRRFLVLPADGSERDGLLVS
jgi:hypothetical protein